MIQGVKNLGSSIASDAKGLTGNIAKAILVFPDPVREIRLEDPERATNFGRAMGMENAADKVAKMKENAINKISQSSATASRLTHTLEDIGGGTSALSTAVSHGVLSGKKFTVQFNPTSLQIGGRAGGRVPISNYGNVGDKQPGTIEYKALDPYINVSFTVLFDSTNISDAFMEETFTVGATSLVKNVATAAVGHEYTVQPYVEGFLAALRNEDHRTMIFQWGNLRYTGVLNSISGRYTMFNKVGSPIRAEVQIGMLMAGAGEDSIDGASYLDFWKNRYSEIIKKHASKDEEGNVASMTAGNIKNQYRNLINL
ncbi:MAG: hypothetical protein IJ282_05805 [Lachnospiraceae bacterium]|nr:hypothetical protein [Lachnospiraceae bacterium]